MASRPTPYSIAVAALITLHAQPSSPLYDKNNKATFENVSKFLQSAVLQNQQQLLTAPHAPPLTILYQNLSSATDPTTAQTVCVWLQTAAASVDAFLDLLSTCRQALRANQQPAVTTAAIVCPLSLLGMYLRSVCLGFEELLFESVALLWKDFKTQVNAMDLNQPPPPQNWPLSAAQIEDALSYETMHSRITLGSVGAYERYEVLQKLLKTHNPELPTAHFLCFVYSLGAGMYDAAEDCLQDCFLLRPPEGLQFGAIVTAAMHFLLGNKGASRAATLEAVRVAQQCNDASCVAFALGWLSLQEPQQLVSEEWMRRCAVRAAECDLQSLSAGANLSLAIMTMNAQRPSAAWTNLMQASAEAPNQNAGEVTNVFDRPLQLTDGKSGDEAMAIVARQRMVMAGLWDTVGQSCLSDVCSEIVLNCHSDQLLSTDIEIVIQNMVRSSLLGFASTIRSVDDDGPAGLPSRLDPSIDNTSTSSNCIYAHALQKLMTLRKRFELPISGVFLFEKVLILHAWAVYRGDLVHAEALGEMLQSHLCPRIPNYADVRIDILTQKCFYLARCKRWNQAKELLTMLIDQCKTEQRRLLHSRLLLQMAMLQLESCPRQFANALQPLLECLSAAYNFELDGVHATALTILAQVHLRMGKTKRALAVVRAALPTVAQNEHVWFQAEAYLTISKCYLQLAKRDGSIRVEMVHSAIANLHQSKDVFSRCQDCLRLKEVYFLLARSYDILPDHTSERDDASENFVLLSHHLIETNCPRKDDFLSSLDDGEKLNDIASRTIPVFVRSN